MVVVEVNGYTIEPGANLREADLEGANLSNANLEEAVIDLTDFTGANLSEANLHWAHITWWGSSANFLGANLTRANLTLAFVERSNFAYADLSGADLTEANLVRALLISANLSGVKLTRARLVVIVDERTVWPDGFDPEAHESYSNLGGTNVPVIFGMWDQNDLSHFGDSLKPPVEWWGSEPESSG